MLVAKMFSGTEFDSFSKHQIDIFDQIDQMFRNNTFSESVSKKYPPHNLLSNGKDAYVIELAVAGYAEKDLKITKEKNLITIEGSMDQKDSDENFLIHRGIASRSFSKSFALGENVKVVGANCENGMLRIGLIKEIPEAEKPVEIPLSTKSSKEMTKLLSLVNRASD